MPDQSLENKASALGTYGLSPTTITSEPITITMVSGLTITKTADKSIWADGELTFTVTIVNGAEQPYVSPVLTDILDTTLIDLVTDSVEVDGEAASYNYTAGTLTVQLEDLAITDNVVVTFRVQKV